MKEERCLCKNFNEWTGECCSATPMCSEPFSKEACVDFKKWVYNRQKGLKKPDFDDLVKEQTTNHLSRSDSRRKRGAML